MRDASRAHSRAASKRPFSNSLEACSSRSGTAGSRPSGDDRQGGAGGSGCGRWAPRTASEASIGLAVEAAGAATIEALAGGLTAGGTSVAGRARLQAGMTAQAAARTIGRKRRVSVIAHLINSRSWRPASRPGAGALSAHGSTRVPIGRETPCLSAWFHRARLLFTSAAPAAAYAQEEEDRRHLEAERGPAAGAPEPTLGEGGAGGRGRTHRVSRGSRVGHRDAAVRLEVSHAGVDRPTDPAVDVRAAVAGVAGIRRSGIR